MSFILERKGTSLQRHSYGGLWSLGEKVHTFRIWHQELLNALDHVEGDPYNERFIAGLLDSLEAELTLLEEALNG